jgi:hypothetical protein
VACVNAEAKVCQLDCTLSRQQDVLKLDVPVGSVTQNNNSIKGLSNPNCLDNPLLPHPSYELNILIQQIAFEGRVRED